MKNIFKKLLIAFVLGCSLYAPAHGMVTIIKESNSLWTKFKLACIQNNINKTRNYDFASFIKPITPHPYKIYFFKLYLRGLYSINKITRPLPGFAKRKNISHPDAAMPLQELLMNEGKLLNKSIEESREHLAEIERNRQAKLQAEKEAQQKLLPAPPIDVEAQEKEQREKEIKELNARIKEEQQAEKETIARRINTQKRFNELHKSFRTNTPFTPELLKVLGRETISY